MSQLLPTVGIRGKFTFRAPFDTRIGNDIVLECVAVREFSDVLAQGRDPFTYYYDIYDLEKSQYNEDVRSNRKLISLRAEDGGFFVVPEHYILSYPPMTGVTYSSTALAVNLGALPDVMQLDHVRNTVERAVKDALGVTPEVKTVRFSKKEDVSYDEHLRLEASRLALIEDSRSDRAKLKEAEDIIRELRNENKMLSDLVVSGG